MVEESTELPERHELHGEVLDSEVLRWLLLDGDRRLLSAGLFVGTFLLFVGLGVLGVIDVKNEESIAAIFGASITGVFTLIAITVSINQLVLSRVLGSIEEIQSRVGGVKEFRDDVARLDPSITVTPTRTGSFMATVTDIPRERAEALREVYGEGRNENVDTLVERIVTLADHVEDRLPEGDSELYPVLSPVLNNPYSRFQHGVQSVRSSETPLSDEERRAFDDLARSLDQLAVFRHYVKTLYIHEALARVSKLTLLSGVPALMIAFSLVLSYGGGWMGTAAAPVAIPVLSLGLTIVLSPLLILFSYFIRIVSIARRTTTFGPFTVQEELP